MDLATTPDAIEATVPDLPGLAPALAGYALYGASAALEQGLLAPGGMVWALVPALGAGMFTAPAFLVAHGWLGLHAAPTAMVGALARAFVVGGKLALGLTPVLFFLSATTAHGLAFFTVFGAGIGVLTLLMAMTELDRAESAAAASAGTGSGGMLALVLCWSVLTAGIATRLGASLVLSTLH